MENLVITGAILATTKKQDDKYKSTAEPRKKAILIFKDKKEVEKAKKFGLKIYTAKESELNHDFCYVKCSAKIQIFAPDIREPMSFLTGDLESPNFKTKDGLYTKLNLVKGENMDNEFIRLTAILAKDLDDVQELEQDNPFS